MAQDRKNGGLEVIGAPMCDDFGTPMLPSGSPSRLVAAPLLGRQRELETLIRLLGRPEVALVTLTGPGGAGKTRLAVQLAFEFETDFADGTVFVPLAAAHDLEVFGASVAQALRLEPGEASGREAIRAFLASHEMLLVLDNLEQLPEAGLAVAELLAAAPRLKVLATSRAPLRISGEHEFPLAGLETPEPDAGLERVLESPAARLFLERARAIRPDFQATAENASAIAELCRRLDGMPLALELAAARVRLFSPQMMLEQLSAPLKFLAGGPRDWPRRQQAIRNTLDWSYELLEPGAQRLLVRLGVFVGGFDLEALEAVCGDANALEGLAALVEHSLVRRLEATPGRFALLEPVREYALEKLGAATGQIRDAHAGHFLQWAESHAVALRGPDQVAWFERFEAEHDNLRAALADFLERGQAEAMLRMTVALRPFWDGRGHHAEARRWLGLALSIPGESPPDVRARALNALGAFTYLQGQLEEANRHVQQALELGRAISDQSSLAGSLRTLGDIATVRGELAQATDLYRQSLAINRQLNDSPEIVRSLIDLGTALVNQGDLEAAQDIHQQGLAMARTLGDQMTILLYLRNLSVIRRRRGDFEGAGRVQHESLELARQLDHPQSIVETLHGLGFNEYRLGHLDAALEHFEDSLTAARKLGYTVLVAVNLRGLGMVNFALGRFEQARGYFEESLHLLRGLGATDRIRETLEQLALTLEQLGQAEAARRHRDELAALNLPAATSGQPFGSIPERNPLTDLTKRELEVLRLLARGLTNPQIADALKLSLHTVITHVRSIFSKLNVPNRAAATRVALERGLG